MHSEKIMCKKVANYNYVERETFSERVSGHYTYTQGVQKVDFKLG